MGIETYYGLPPEVKFCSNCVMSNQRPVSEIEFKHTIKTKKRTSTSMKMTFVTPV